MDLTTSRYLYATIAPLAVALYVLGVALKKTPMIRDWLIPWILMGVGILAAVLLLEPSVDAVMQGLLACGASVLSNQLYKQTAEKRVEDAK